MKNKLENKQTTYWRCIHLLYFWSLVGNSRIRPGKKGVEKAMREMTWLVPRVYSTKQDHVRNQSTPNRSAATPKQNTSEQSLPAEHQEGMGKTPLRKHPRFYQWVEMK